VSLAPERQVRFGVLAAVRERLQVMELESMRFLAATTGGVVDIRAAMRVALEYGSANAGGNVPGARHRGFRFRRACRRVPGSVRRGPRASALFLELRDEGAQSLELDLVERRWVFAVPVQMGGQRLSAFDELDVFLGRRELNFVAQPLVQRSALARITPRARPLPIRVAGRPG
jgi:hypothetical protein